MKIQENHTVREMTADEETEYRAQIDSIEPDANQTLDILLGGAGE